MIVLLECDDPLVIFALSVRMLIPSMDQISQRNGNHWRWNNLKVSPGTKFLYRELKICGAKSSVFHQQVETYTNLPPGVGTPIE